MPESIDHTARPKRILVAECKQEVSTFNPLPSRYEDFYVREGAELFAHHRLVESEVGGAMEVLLAMPGVETVPVWGASCKNCGGRLVAEDWNWLRGEFSKAMSAAPPADGILLCLHGAMAAEGEDDPEGWLLAETRRLYGEDIPIVISLDLHGVATTRMFELSDAIVAFHTYPHVDLRQTGRRAASLLGRILTQGIRPVTARVSVPVLVRGDELITETGAIAKPIRLAQAFEAQAPGLSAGLFIGNPFTDVHELQSYAFAVADGDEDEAWKTALQLAGLLWGDHQKMQVPLVSLPETLAALRASNGGTIALVDAADATSSGASGDSNAILRAVLADGWGGSMLMPLVDAPAVKSAFSAGVGAEITVPLGGTVDRRRFTPIVVTATVRLLSDGRFPSESWAEEWNSGCSAVLQVGNITVVVMSRPVHLFDRSLFWGHGQDPRQFDAVVVKSPHCQHHMYAAWCTRMINVDAPGSASANLRSLGHTHCPRPIFPLDDEVPFDTRAQLFQRPRYRK